MPKVFTSIFIISLFFCNTLFAQKDSTLKKNTRIFGKPDSTKLFNPGIATYRSAILPGWGQATNKKYWKIPIVYAALGATTYIFFRNLKQYKEADAAYTNAIDGNPANDSLIKQPYYSVKDQPDRIRSFRNDVRQNVDYSVLVFIIFWGLNVVDATVDAHLKSFDVSDELSLQIKPGYSQMGNTNGLSIVLNIGKTTQNNYLHPAGLILKK